MNKDSKIITTLLLVGCLFSSAFVFAENKRPVNHTTAEERRQIEEYFVKVLNGELETEITDPIEENLPEAFEVVQEKKRIYTNRYTTAESIQDVKVEKKTAEQYIILLKELDKEIESIESDKKKALAQLDADVKAEIKVSYQEIEETTVQKFTEKDADFATRKKGLKEAAMKTANNKLEQEKQKLSLSYDQTIQNRQITKETVMKELKQIEFIEPCEIVIGDFFRENTPQYFPVIITCTKLDLNAYKGRLEIEKNDETKALYIEHNRENFEGRVIYRVDIQNNLKLKLIAAEILDKNGDKLVKRFEDFSYKSEVAKTSQAEKENKKKAKEKKYRKRDRYTNSVSNELIVSANNNFCNDFNDMCVNVQYLPLCLYNNHYLLKVGGGISFNNNYEIMAVVKNGLNFKLLSLELGTGIVFRDFNFREIKYLLSAETEFRFTDYLGMNIAYRPADFCIKNNNVNTDWKHTVSFGLTLTGMYF